MRNSGGFSLIELIIVMAIAGILIGLGTMAFEGYSKKAAIEAQVKMMYSELMLVRGEAFYRKQSRAITVSGNEFKIFATEDTAVEPVQVKKLAYPVLSNNSDTIIIDTAGLLNTSGIDGKSICVNAGENSAVVDSLVLSTSRMQLGKWDLPGGSASDCKANKITR